jgi:hypothetical protein
MVKQLANIEGMEIKQLLLTPKKEPNRNSRLIIATGHMTLHKNSQHKIAYLKVQHDKFSNM